MFLIFARVIIIIIIIISLKDRMWKQLKICCLLIHSKDARNQNSSDFFFQNVCHYSFVSIHKNDVFQ